MYYLGLIPARGGSKGIPRKNTTLLAGLPLISYSIQAANQSTRLDQCVVSTDDEQIKSVAEEYGGNVPFLRPEALSADASSAGDVMGHAINELCLDPDRTAIVYLQPTSPLRTTDDIDSAIAHFEKSSADTLVSVVEVPHNFAAESQMILRDGQLSPLFDNVALQRQAKAIRYARNGPAILICRARNIIEGRSFYDSKLKVVPMVMPIQRSVDIDDISDLLIAENTLKQQENRL